MIKRTLTLLALVAGPLVPDPVAADTASGDRMVFGGAAERYERVIREAQFRRRPGAEDAPDVQRRPGPAGEPVPPPGGWALPDSAFHHREGLLPSPEVRAVALAKLAPRPGMLVWDIGAGSGSVAVECARMGAAVLAVERDPGETTAWFTPQRASVSTSTLAQSEFRLRASGNEPFDMSAEPSVLRRLRRKAAQRVFDQRRDLFRR